MATLYRIVKETYHRLIPVKFRGGFHDETRPLGKLSMKWLKRLEATGQHDEIYDRDYYERIVDPFSLKSAPFIAQSVIDAFKPKSVIDVGCGTGALLSAFKQRGVDVMGLERSIAGIEACKSRDIPVTVCDLEKTSSINMKADVVMSMEVAEHIPEQYADLYLDILVSIAPIVVITAARPGQNGHDHVNEQPPDYWIKKLADRNLDYDQDTGARWHDLWKDCGVESCFYENLLVFTQRRLVTKVDGNLNRD